MLVQALECSFLCLHVQSVIQIVVNSELLVDLSRSVALISCELGRAMIVQLDKMLLLDWVFRHPHIVSENLRLFLEVRALDTPADSARYPRHCPHNGRLIVEGRLLGAHLFCQEPGVGWLVDTGRWVLNLLV